jgi:hypothetical protein
MITQIIKFHQELKKGESVKIITILSDYETYVNKTDLLKIENRKLLIFRANGAKVALNNKYIVACCVVERF